MVNVVCPSRVGAKTQPESKCPELLANYCDMLLRKTPLSKKLTSEEVEKKLKDVVRTAHVKYKMFSCWNRHFTTVFVSLINTTTSTKPGP